MLDLVWGGDHLVPDSGLEKEEDNFCGGKPKPFLSSAKLLIVTVHKTLYVTYTCRFISIIFVKSKSLPLDFSSMTSFRSDSFMKFYGKS